MGLAFLNHFFDWKRITLEPVQGLSRGARAPSARRPIGLERSAEVFLPLLVQSLLLTTEQGPASLPRGIHTLSFGVPDKLLTYGVCLEPPLDCLFSESPPSKAKDTDSALGTYHRKELPFSALLFIPSFGWNNVPPPP